MTDAQKILLIKAVVAQRTCVMIRDLESPKRGSAKVSDARFIAMALCRKFTELSLREIGGAFGNRDSSTAFVSSRRVDELKLIPEYAAAIGDLQFALQKRFSVRPALDRIEPAAGRAIG